MIPALVEKKLSKKAFKAYIDDPKVRNYLDEKVYNLKISPHISAK